MKRPIIEKNVHSDFDFILKLKSKNGKEVGFPSYDFEGRIYSHDHHHINPFDRGHFYTISRRGETMKNCFDDKGRLHIVMNNHRLPPGRLHLDLVSFLPNPIYKDGVKKVEDKLVLGIELVEGPGDHDFFIEDEEVILSYVYYTAYELAKAGGFDGTEEEFNEALAGIAGLTEKSKDNSIEIVRLKEKLRLLNRGLNCLDNGIKELEKNVGLSLRRINDNIDTERQRAKKAEKELDERITLLGDNFRRESFLFSENLKGEIERALKEEKTLREAIDGLTKAQKNLRGDFKELDDHIKRRLRRLGDDLYEESRRAKEAERGLKDVITQGLDTMGKSLAEESARAQEREKEIEGKVKEVKQFLKNMEEFTEEDIREAIGM
ncbi:MAG: hypothetical protein J1D77_03640 [Muribaculaceae bacterium]|nr:hypothetical protein [Muribaculaceae bacterium]